MIKSLLILSLSFFSVLLQAEPVSKSYWGDKAIGSHDTVAYHQDAVKKAHKAVTGNQQFIVKYSGANWYFVSAASAAKFAQDPDKYKPLFNGFCANALSLGEGLVPTNGKIWEFFGDQLHLFYAEAGRQRWLTGDWQQYQQVAHSAWAGLKDK